MHARKCAVPRQSLRFGGLLLFGLLLCFQPQHAAAAGDTEMLLAAPLEQTSATVTMISSTFSPM